MTKRFLPKIHIILPLFILLRFCSDADTDDLPNLEETTTEGYETDTTTIEIKNDEGVEIGAWLGRKINADHILNDLISEQNHSLDEIPASFRPIEEQSHPCSRECVGEPPRICRYKFKVEWFQTMSKACYDCPYNKTHCNRIHCIPGDGMKRPVLVVNRQMPGPAIEICHKDVVVVEVENALMEEGTSIHWHGQHQRKSPYMDGVPFVTQCPIHPKSTFAYRFTADIPGTHFWHSHSALQRGDGMFGALIVKTPRSEDVHSEFFDFDLPSHVMIVSDWSHSPGITKFIAHHHSDGDNKPEGILVNGKGRYLEFEDELGTIHTTPLERFDVKEGSRFRFRIINAGFLNCPIEMSIDNHTMVVINSDGNDLEPEEASSLVTYAGERFDIIVEMDQKVDNYWIRYRGLMDCDERFTSAYQLAVLHYEGASGRLPSGERPNYENSKREGLQVNSLNSGFQWNDSLSVPELKAISPQSDPRLNPEADFKFYVAYDFYPLDNPLMHLPEHYGFTQIEKRNERIFTPQLNHISMKLPPFPLLVEPDDAEKLDFCNATSISRECENKFCECTHLLHVDLDSVVEIILVDKGFTYDANHPFHLHGHSFRVIGMDRLGSNVTVEQVKQLDSEGKLRRNFYYPPIKDTITVPDGGYTVLRWQAINPGYWLFHCHIDYHVELGMAIVFKVGENKDFEPVPRRFPRCNDFSPSDDDRTTTTERSFHYRNYNKSHPVEIEFDIDNTLQFLGRTNSSQRQSYMCSKFLIIVLCIFNIAMSRMTR